MPDLLICINLFVYQYLPFFMQITVAEVIFCAGLRRRALFPVRVAAALAMGAAAVFLLCVPAMFIVNIPVLSGSLMYIVIFVLTVLLEKVCFDAPFMHLLFRGISAYAMQNLTYALYGVFWMACWGSGWFFSVQETFDIGSFANAFNAAACLMVYPVIFLLFGRRYAHLRTDVLYNRHILAVSVCALAVCIVFCSVCNTYAQWVMPLYISCMAFIALFCVFVLLTQSGMLERGKDRHEIAIIRGLLEKEKTQYALTKESIELINIKCHDLRHRLREMRQSGEVSARELEQVERAINVYDSHIETGNGTLDIVLSEQILFCENAGIRLMCAADAEGLSFMSPSDIYSLFGNILENARDAVRKVISPDLKYINFSVRRVADMLIVSEDNHYEGELHFENDLPLTTHANTEDHGFGMKSVRMIVRTYGGDMDISARGGVFRLRIAFALRG